jgi:PAS domain S-box-containing protein
MMTHSAVHEAGKTPAGFPSSNPSCSSSVATVTVPEEVILQYEARIKQLEEENARLRRKQVEINTAKELYLKIFEDFPALIWRSRTDKLCDHFNKTWLDWTGKTLEQEFGNGWTQGIHPDDFDTCVEIYVTAFDKRESFCMDYRLMNKHGEYRWIRDYGRPFHDLDGEFLGYIGSCYDVQDEKLNEQKLIKLNATKDRFFRIVAHDLRNPISAFVTFSEFLVENHDDFDEGEMAELSTEMYKDAKNTLSLLENLLEWSKTQTDEIKYEPTELDLCDICYEVVSQSELCAKNKDIKIDCSLCSAEGPPTTCVVDKNMITTVLRNLIGNAIKFTHPGGNIKIEGEFDPNDQTLTVIVSDNGVGIDDQKQLDSLFDLVKKNRRSSKGTDNESGSGLGLVICKDFIERHGGKIWAESEGAGKGTKIKFALPHKKEEAK